MNDFIAKYKNAQKGVKPKQQSKDAKKAITKALHQTFKMAIDGQLAGINHDGIQYVMMKQELFNNIIQTGGKVLISDEQKAFHKEYQILLNMMQSLQIEDEEESRLFDEVDQFTFEFSQFMNDPNASKKRREIVTEFKELVDTSPILIEMYDNFKAQLFPTEQETKEVENGGKLT